MVVRDCSKCEVEVTICFIFRLWREGSRTNEEGPVFGEEGRVVEDDFCLFWGVGNALFAPL